MSLSILTNVAALDTHRNLLMSSDSVAQSMQRLSSGLRINTAADDAAGFAISEGLTAQVNGLDQAGRNVNDAVSMVQTAESSLNNVQGMLQRVRELAVQFKNGSLSTADQGAIQNEVNQLTQEIDRQRGAEKFNGISLLDGSAGGGTGTITFQVGANQGDTLTAKFADIEGATGVQSGSAFTWANASAGGKVLDLSSATVLSGLDTAIGNVSSQAATLGAVQNRLQFTSDIISSTQENLAASNSQIKDVDMAQQMTMLTQQQILQQAGTAMLAQANAAPQLVLKLLG